MVSIKEFSYQVVKQFFLNKFFIVFLIVGFLCFIFYKKILGWFGEHWTKKSLHELPRESYKVINNLLIEVDGRTSQIDHVVVSRYGVFCIETKQYNGFITGNKYDDKWVRHAGNKKYYYSNPIKQNYGHIKQLAKLLDIDESLIINIVSIPSKATLKIKDDGEVCRYYNLAEKILSYDDLIIDNPREIINKLLDSNIMNRENNKNHIQNVKSSRKQNDYSKCPFCGGDLTKRNGKYGYFLGCSNYPKCKYTRKVK